MGIHHIAIMASGKGSNAEALLTYFEHHENIKVSLLLSNKTNSGVVTLSEKFEVPYFIFSRDEFLDEQIILRQLKLHQVDFIVLAGFLWLIPNYLIQAFQNKIINIHPALLPKHGGKGMYGIRVHQEVFNHHEKTSGLTIHLVDANYDEGKILFQKEVSIEDCPTPEDIAAKVLKNEHECYPKVVAEYILSFKET
jgi:phosphoribosylglycinamide formyltransferase-1